MPADKAESPDPISWRELLARAEASTGNLPVVCLVYSNVAAELAELLGAGATAARAYYPLLNLCSNHKGSRKKVGSGSSGFVGGHLLVMRYLFVSLTICLIQATEVKAQGALPGPRGC
jgi:hypothetical protein